MGLEPIGGPIGGQDGNNLPGIELKSVLTRLIRTKSIAEELHVGIRNGQDGAIRAVLRCPRHQQSEHQPLKRPATLPSPLMQIG
jgi:hypothetical protein